MYAKAKVGGFLHLAIGEEATIVGSARAMRDDDYLISTYRSHGHALVRGTSPNGVMAELFGRVDGVSNGRGGSMHMFDLEKRFMGGYGIVGGNLPIAAGFGLASDYLGTEDATLCTFGDGASNQGTFGETMNLAALWKLPVVFMVTNNQFGMGTVARAPLGGHRPAAQGRGLRRARAWSATAWTCSTPTWSPRRRCASRARSAGRCSSRRSPTASAATRWPTPRSTAPRSRSRSGASATRSCSGAIAWRPRRSSPPSEREQFDQDAIAHVDEAVAFADESADARARVALRRRLRPRRPGPRLVLGRRALGRRAQGRGRARARRAARQRPTTTAGRARPATSRSR